MLYSSGTTGHPKGIRRPLTGQPFGSDVVLSGMLGGIMGFAPGDVYLSPAPLYHSAPLVWSMTAQRMGGTVVVMEHFDPERCLALIEEHKVTHAQFVPTMFVRMLKLPDEVRSKLRPLVAALGGACRRALRARGQAPHDRVVGAGDPRVLLGHRGHGHDVDHLRGGPDASRLGGQGHLGRGARLRRRRGGPPGRRGRRGVLRRAHAGPPRSSTTTIPRRRAQTFNDKGWSTLWDVGHRRRRRATCT